MSLLQYEKCKHHVPWAFCEICHQAEDSCGISHTTILYDPADFGVSTDSGHSGGGSSSYYELPSDCQTLQDVIVKKGMDFTRGNIFKAAYRWDAKPSLQYNLEKIIWFAQDALNRIYAEQKRNLHGPGND